MLIYVGNELLEIRPNQIIKSRKKLNSSHLILIENKKSKSIKIKKATKKQNKTIKGEWPDASA